jgi:hypothetical protein
VISQIHEQNTKKTGAIYHQGKYQFHFDQLWPTFELSGGCYTLPPPPPPSL